EHYVLMRAALCANRSPRYARRRAYGASRYARRYRIRPRPAKVRRGRLALAGIGRGRGHHVLMRTVLRDAVAAARRHVPGQIHRQNVSRALERRRLTWRADWNHRAWTR